MWLALWDGSRQLPEAAPGSSETQVLQVGHREFGPAWVIQIQGSFAGAAC
jgi:hypothetical protein